MPITARSALADALAVELDIDINPAFMAGVDRVLIRLWLHGYAIREAQDDDEEIAA